MTTLNFQTLLIRVAVNMLAKHREQFAEDCLAKARGTRYDPARGCSQPPREWCARAVVETHWDWSEFPVSTRNVDDVLSAAAYAAGLSIDRELFTLQLTTRMAEYLRSQSYAEIRKLWQEEAKATA